MEVPLEIECLPWNRVLAGADSGDWGVGGIYMNIERLSQHGTEVYVWRWYYG